MSYTSNYGSQVLTHSYQESLNSTIFNSAYKNLIKSGIYTGFSMSFSTGTVTINPGVMFIIDTNSGDYSVRCETTVAFSISATVGNYIVARYSYASLLNNYVDFIATSTPLSNDIILGIANTIIDYSSRTYANLAIEKILLQNSIPGSSLTMAINPGTNFWYIKSSTNDISYIDIKQEVLISLLSPTQGDYFLIYNGTAFTTISTTSETISFDVKRNGWYDSSDNRILAYFNINNIIGTFSLSILEIFGNNTNGSGSTYIDRNKIQVVSTSTYNVLPSQANYKFEINATSNAVTMNLPPVSISKGISLEFIRTDAVNTNTVTIDANGSETIDGSLTYILLSQYDYFKIFCDGTEWKIQIKTFGQPNYLVANIAEYINVQLDGNNPPKVVSGTTFYLNISTFKGVYQLTSDQTFTWNTGAFPVQAATTVYYLYAKYVNGSIVFGASTNAPTYNDLLQGWYSTDGRVLCRFYSAAIAPSPSSNLHIYTRDLVAVLVADSATTAALDVNIGSIIKYKNEIEIRFKALWVTASGTTSLHVHWGNGSSDTSDSNYYSIYAPLTCATTGTAVTVSSNRYNYPRISAFITSITPLIGNINLRFDPTIQKGYAQSRVSFGGSTSQSEIADVSQAAAVAISDITNVQIAGDTGTAIAVGSYIKVYRRL